MTTRIAARAALAALALSAALAGAALGPAPALAMAGHGGFGHHGHGGHWGHGRWGDGRWGHRHGRAGFYAAAYPAYYGGCVVRRFIDADGDLIVRRRCY